MSLKRLRFIRSPTFNSNVSTLVVVYFCSVTIQASRNLIGINKIVFIFFCIASTSTIANHVSSLNEVFVVDFRCYYCSKLVQSVDFTAAATHRPMFKPQQASPSDSRSTEVVLETSRANIKQIIFDLYAQNPRITKRAFTLPQIFIQ